MRRTGPLKWFVFYIIDIPVLLTFVLWCGFVEQFSCNFAFTLLLATRLFKLSKEVDSLSEFSQSRIRADRTHTRAKIGLYFPHKQSVFWTTVWRWKIPNWKIQILGEFVVWALMAQEFKGIFWVIFHVMSMDSICGILSIKIEKKKNHNLD